MMKTSTWTYTIDMEKFISLPGEPQLTEEQLRKVLALQGYSLEKIPDQKRERNVMDFENFSQNFSHSMNI